MNLEQNVNRLICNFPTLFRDCSYQRSRMKVLDHMFLSYGTGYWWSRKGNLVRSERNKKPKVKNTLYPFKSIPEGFFEKNLFEMDVRNSELDFFCSLIEGKFHYFIEEKFSENTCVFEATESEVKEIERKMESVIDSPDDRIRMYYCFARKAVSLHERTPPHSCRHSPIAEMTEGRTSDNDFFEFTPRADLIKGGIECATDALDYYNRLERFEKHTVYPANQLIQMKRDVELAKGEKTLWQKNLKTNEDGSVETAEQFAERIWVDFKKEQVELLTKFLSKFNAGIKT